MKRHHGRHIILALALAALLAGCWGSDKSTSLELTQSGNVVATAAAVGIDKCHNCHADTAVNAVRIFDSWASSRHANLDNSFDAYDNSIGNPKPYHGTLPYSGYELVPDGDCTPCHDPNADSLKLADYVGPGSSATPRWVIGCEACHGGGERHFGVGPIGGPSTGFYAVAATTGQSSQYNTCTRCHQETPTEHGSKPYRLIADTHFDNASRAVGSDIQGYVLRKGADTACVDCHNPHTANLVLNRQWKESAHGDFTGDAWKHYKWTDANRAACQRCHTTTGFVNYTTGQLTYNAANNVFAAVGNQSEMLYCYGCHKLDARGPADRRVVDNAYLPAGPGVNDTAVITGMGDSEICLNCHSGRESGSQIKANMAGKNMDNTAFGSFNSHSLLAGATLFQDNTFSVTDNQFTGPGAYQFVGKDYAKPADYEHDTLDGDPKGPCVGCHMSSPNSSDPTVGSHSFMPVTHDNTGAMTAITSTKCATCHDGVEAPVLSVAFLEARESRFDGRIDELKAALELRGIYYNPAAYPYFYADAGFTTQFKTWQTKAATLGIATEDLVGAAFNLNYFAHEPGAYVHNSVYTGRVLFDSIEKVGFTPSPANFPTGRP